MVNEYSKYEWCQDSKGEMNKIGQPHVGLVLDICIIKPRCHAHI